MLTLGQYRSFDKGDLFVENARVVGDLNVVRHGEREPEQIVRAQGSHPRAGGRVPPVLDIALLELPRRGRQDMLPREFGSRINEPDRILQLIPEPKRSAGLI